MKQLPRISIAGRAMPQDVCLVALYLNKLGYVLNTRSDLVNATFDAMANLARQLDTDLPNEVDNHDSMLMLQSLDLEWPSKRGKNDWRSALQLDTLKDLSPEQIEQVNNYAASLSTGASSESNSLVANGLDFLDELEELDLSLRGESEENE